MSTYDQIAWLPLCGGLTGLGLVLSYFVMRRRGLGAGLRWAAWSLLPLAAYLTGSIKMFWKMGVAIGDFAKGFVFSAEVWSGIAVAGLAVVLFVVSGRLRRRGKRGQDQQAVGAKAARPPRRPPGGRSLPGRHRSPPRRRPRPRSRRGRARTRPTMTTTSGTSRTSCAATASPDGPAPVASRGRRLRSRPPRPGNGYLPAKRSVRSHAAVSRGARMFTPYRVASSLGAD